MLYFSYLTETYNPDGVNAVSPSAPVVFGSQYDSLLKNINNMSNGVYAPSAESSVNAGFDPKNIFPLSYTDIENNKTAYDIAQQMNGEGTHPGGVTDIRRPVSTPEEEAEFKRQKEEEDAERLALQIQNQMKGEGTTPPSNPPAFDNDPRHMTPEEKRDNQTAVDIQNQLAGDGMPPESPEDKSKRGSVLPYIAGGLGGLAALGGGGAYLYNKYRQKNMR